MTLNDIAQRTSDRLANEYGRTLPASWIFAQLAHETGGGTSDLAVNYNNFAGLTQTQNNGLPQPDGGNYYMSFDSQEDFADYFADYLNLYAEDGLFDATNLQEYAGALKHGGYFGDSVENYVNGMSNWIGNNDAVGFDDFAMIADNQLNPKMPLDIKPVEINTKKIEAASFEDKFFDSLYDSAIWGTFRTFAAKKNMPDDTNFKLTQEDIDGIQKELGGDYAATLYVCQNAHSAAQLRKLTNMKREDIERRKRVEDSDIDWNTLGTIAGGLLDPLNYIPIAGAAGKVGKVAHYAKLAGANAAFNAAERAATQHLTGYQQNLPMAALTGALAGGVVPFGFDMAKKALSKTVKAGRDMMGQGLVLKDTANALANGTKAPNQVLSSADFLERLNKLHDIEFSSQIADRALSKRLSPKKGVFVTSLKDAQQLYKEYGVDVPSNAKALYDDATNTAVLIKDNINDLSQVEKLLWHEKGAHGLRYILKEKEYNALIDKVRDKMRNNPSPAMRRAMAKAEGSRNPDEILGYLVEEAKPSNPLMKSLRKAVNRAYSAAGFKGRISDDELVDIVKAAAKVNMENEKGYRMLADGSTVYHGVHFSQDNPVNPAVVEKNIKGTLKDWAQRSAIIATPYSLARNSLSKVMREFGDAMMINPYMDKALSRIPVEEFKRQIVNRLNPHINEYHNIRNQYVLKKLPVFGRMRAGMKTDFDKAVDICYNATYGNNIAAHIGEQFDPLVMEAAKIKKKLRDTIIDIGQNYDKMTGGLGENLFDKEWKNIDDESWRFIDADRLASFICQFKDGKEGARIFLTEYAIKAAKRDVIRQQLEEKAKREWQAEAQKLAHKGLPAPKKPEPITDTRLEEEIKKMANEWALGIVDHNTHNRGVSIRDITDGAKSIPNFQHRMPMDTSTVMVSPHGLEFSFDNDIREFDFDRTVPYLCNRIAGEAALSTYIKNTNKQVKDYFGNAISVKDNVANKRKEIEIELKDARDHGLISDSDVKQELDAFDYVISKIRGIDTEYKPKTYGDAHAELLTNTSFFQNGGLMGVSQFGEMGGLMAHCGIDSLLDIMPGIGRTLRDIQYGKEFNKNMDDVTLDVMGDEVSQYIWHNVEATSTRNYRDVAAHNSSVASAMDAVGGYVKTMDSVVNTLSLLPKLEYAMRQSARKQTVIDVVKWVGGKNFGWWRNPFSKGKCEAAGIVDADAFRETLKPYLKFDAKGKLISFDYKALEKADPNNAIRFRTLVDNQSNRAVTSNNTIGDANLLKGTSPFWRVFFQFKDFALRATHTQSMRAFKNREVEDFLSFGFSVFTTAAATLMADNMRAWAKYPNNESKRKEYLKKNDMQDKKTWLRFIQRTPMLSFTSPAVDALDATGMNPLESARTTVSRTSKNKKSFVDSPDTYLGEAITQLPAVRTGFDALKTVANSSKDMYNKGKLSKDDIRLITDTMIGRTTLPAVYLREELLKNSSRQEKYKYSN